MVEILDVIYRRRAVKVFEPVEISDGVRERILDAARYAPSSFNLQPYKFYWVQTAEKKRAVFWVVNLRRVIGMPPLFRQEIFKWAARSTSLACQNLMIAAEALGMSTCPMEGFDGRRLGRYLGLSRRKQEVVMVIAVGKRSSEYREWPQWRRPLETTVVEL